MTGLQYPVNHTGPPQKRTFCTHCYCFSKAFPFCLIFVCKVWKWILFYTHFDKRAQPLNKTTQSAITVQKPHKGNTYETFQTKMLCRFVFNCIQNTNTLQTFLLKLANILAGETTIQIHILSSQTRRRKRRDEEEMFTRVWRWLSWASSDRLPLKVKVGRARPDTPRSRNSCSSVRQANFPTSSFVFVVLSNPVKHLIIPGRSRTRNNTSSMLSPWRRSRRRTNRSRRQMKASKDDNFGLPWKPKCS